MIDENQNIRQLIKENKFYLLSLAIYTFLFLFFCSKMSPLYPTNDWEDVSVYFSVGKAMIEGRTLYSEIFDPKGPLIFLIYGVSYLFSSTSYFPLYLFFSAIWTIALFFIFLTAFRIIANRLWALLIAIFTPIFALKYMYYGGSPEEMILVAHLISLYVFCNYFIGQQSISNAKHSIILGICVATILFLKFNLAVFIFFPTVGFFFSITLHEGAVKALKTIAYFFIGLAIISLPILSYLLYNNAFQDTIDTYILLNKELAVSVPMATLIQDGVLRIYNMFRENLIGAILVFIGIFYAPFVLFKNNTGKITFLLGGLALCAMIFCAGVFHAYYPLPLYVFAPLGFIVFCQSMAKLIYIPEANKLAYLFIFAGLLIANNIVSFFDMGGVEIARKQDPSGPAYQFKHSVEQVKKPTLLNLAYGQTLSLYTICDIQPNVRYFTTLNIDYDKYPNLRDEQSKYLENGATIFVTLNNFNPSFEYFRHKSALDRNYSLIDSCVIENDYITDRFNTFYLYKKKN